MRQGTLYILFFLSILLIIFCVLSQSIIIEPFDYYKTVATPANFYEVSAQLPEHHYAKEMPTSFFTNILDTEKSKSASSILHINDKASSVKDRALEQRCLQNTDMYLTDLFNNSLFNKKFLFKLIKSDVESSHTGVYDNKPCIMLESSHILYRETKMYGVSISTTTCHLLSDLIQAGSQGQMQGLALIDYTLNGFVFEDKIFSKEPSNLIEESDTYQVYQT